MDNLQELAAAAKTRSVPKQNPPAIPYQSVSSQQVPEYHYLRIYSFILSIFGWVFIALGAITLLGFSSYFAVTLRGFGVVKTFPMVLVFSLILMFPGLVLLAFAQYLTAFRDLVRNSYRI